VFAEYYGSIVRLNKVGIIRPELLAQLGFKEAAKTDRPRLPPGVEAAVIINPAATSKKKGKVKPTMPTTDEKTPDLIEGDQDWDKQIAEVHKLIAADCAELGKVQSRLIAHQSLLTALLNRHLSS
jgi:hypothetical protein